MESVKVYGILPDMGMDMEDHGLADLGQFIEGGQGNNDTVADTVDIHDALGDRFFDEDSAEPGDHFRWVPSFKKLM